MAKIAGHGLVCWNLVSDNGNILSLKLPCHHVPEAKIRLLSPQDFCQFNDLDHSKDHFGGNSNYFWMHASSCKQRFICPSDPRSNLPIAFARIPCNHPDQISTNRHSKACPTCFDSFHSHSLASINDRNQNITSCQRELLLWHFRLAHLGFRHIQKLMRARECTDTIQSIPNLSSGEPIDKSAFKHPCLITKSPATPTCLPPLCAACEIAKAKRRPTKVTQVKVLQQHLLKTNQLFPGDCVSLDQYESAVRGQLPMGRIVEKIKI